MTQITSYIIAIPAYNEADSIVATLESIYAASLHTPQTLEKIIVCVNGCTDTTEEKVKQWNKLPITILHSRPGLVPAMNRLIQYARRHHNSAAFIKTDADSILGSSSLTPLFAQLDRHPALQIVGGHPTPHIPQKWNMYERFIAKILSVRGRVPLSEISVMPTRAYHSYATVDPLPNIEDREYRLKIYFHGRLWCMREAGLLPFLPAGVIGEDVYLPGWLFANYGKDSVRMDYRSKVYFKPNKSLRRHWMVYRRIYEDRRRVYAISEFEEYAQHCPLKLDWKFILTRAPKREVVYFLLYTAIVWAENVSFRMVSYKSHYWQYKRKEI